MPAATTLFFCSKCGAQFLKWSGRCTECGGWGTVSEEVTASNPAPSRTGTAKPAKTESFQNLMHEPREARVATQLACFDRLLSGGLVAGSVTLLGGEPGIGKSTLLAQLALALALRNEKILYVTGEESPSQVALRLQRLTQALPASLEFLNTTQTDVIAATIASTKPTLTIVDSLQTLRVNDVPGEPGNPSQVKAGAAILAETAKAHHTSVILVGQVNKEGDLAGPRLVEHLVDTVMMLEGDRDHSFRLLRVLKHRFGVTDELAVLTMTERGLEEVLDPSAALLTNRPINAPGTIVTCLLQGSRPLLVEVQALVSPAGYGTPLRRANGIDTNRLSLLLAVLGRRAGLSLADQDVFVNIVGGIDAREPAVDLALCLALASAKKNVAIPSTTAAWGEVGLSGEIRSVPRSETRLKEIARLGFKTLISPAEKTKHDSAVHVIGCTSLEEALRFDKT